MADPPLENVANDGKAWDENRPFIRINSPSFLPGFVRLSGNCHARGTRRPDDFLKRALIDEIVANVIRTVPSWVPTEGENHQVEAEANVEQELFGRLARSYQTWTDTPPYQWHKWYDWNFHVEPAAPFGWLRGLGNVPPQIESPEPVIVLDPNGETRVEFRPWTLVVTGQTMECEWDTGAIGGYPFATDPNATYIPGSNPNDPRRTGGPMFERDWAWPMTGEHIWLLGRSIYDGGHEAEASIEGVKRKTGRSELHPCKAAAGARWEGAVFKDKGGAPLHDGKAIPAIQFMFFASRHGGYHEFASLQPKNGKPYEFIVDLPEAPWDVGPTEISIGASPDVPMNTIVLRENTLVKDADHARFTNARGATAAVDPEVELLKPPDPASPRKLQAKVTIPVAALTGDYYGVVLSLGFRDHTGEMAARVRKCDVRLAKVKAGNQAHDNLLTEIWRFKCGVNGRWREKTFKTGFNDESTIMAPGDQFTIFLHEDHALKFSSHGAQLRALDQIYFDVQRAVIIDPVELAEERQMPIPIDFDPNHAPDPPPPPPPAPDGGPAVWSKHIDIRPPKPEVKLDPSPIADNTKLLFNATYPEQRAAVRGSVTLQAKTLAAENKPLGIIDPDHGPPHERAFNPLKIKDLPLGQKQTHTLTGYFTSEVGSLAELVERPHDNPVHANNFDFMDYFLTYEVTVTEQ